MADTTPLDYTSLPHTKAIQTGAHTHTHTHTQWASSGLMSLPCSADTALWVISFQGLCFCLCSPGSILLSKSVHSSKRRKEQRLGLRAQTWHSSIRKRKKIKFFFFFCVYTFGKKITPRVRENVTQARVWSAAVFPFSHAALMDSPHV